MNPLRPRIDAVEGQQQHPPPLPLLLVALLVPAPLVFLVGEDVRPVSNGTSSLRGFGGVGRRTATAEDGMPPVVVGRGATVAAAPVSAVDPAR